MLSDVNGNLDRYQRQMVLAEIGLTGQRKLLNSKVLLVGLGGLGCPASLYLAAAGVGKIGLMDGDRICVSNLQRQVLFSTADQGKLKVEIAKQKLGALNPDLQIETYPFMLTPQNALETFEGWDVIIDGTDNFFAKYLINDAAVKLSLPVVYGSISGFEGQLSVFWSPHGPCYRCLYPEPPKGFIPNCAQAGVVGSVAGTIGSLQAMETLKLLLNENGSTLLPGVGSLFFMDLATMESRRLKLTKKEDCSVCSISPSSIVLKEETPSMCVPTLNEEDPIEISIHEIEKTNDPDRFFFIDVREDVEWYGGYIPGAVHFSLSRLRNNETPKLSGIEGKLLVIYCRSGVRSLEALEHFKRHGFNYAKSLAEGILGWPGKLDKPL